MKKYNFIRFDDEVRMDVKTVEFKKIAVILNDSITVPGSTPLLGGKGIYKGLNISDTSQFLKNPNRYKHVFKFRSLDSPFILVKSRNSDSMLVIKVRDTFYFWRRDF